ncbi:hypothetical protein ACFWPH_34520 [Nocardia sp. NPDC058499]|uniref:hypothetical protein n=1 Tax=Nocardia sp. NPDC058499 TaxID=3346530 RepID=UPI003660ACB5
MLTGRILTWDPPRILEFLWGDEHLRFGLEPDRAGTRLVCTVRLGARPRGHTGYHVCLDSLCELMETGSVEDPGPERIAELEKRYAVFGLDRSGAD